MKISRLSLSLLALLLAILGWTSVASGDLGVGRPGEATESVGPLRAMPSVLSAWPPPEKFGDANWSDRFGEANLIDYRSGYMDDILYAVQEYDARLVVGGKFTVAGGYPVRNLAIWDGDSYSPFPGGVVGSVYAMTVFQGHLVVAGSFSQAGEVSANNIAMWDGSAWHPLGSGVDDQIYALVEYQGHLIAGGKFRTAGEHAVGGIAQWNGQSWSPVGSGVEPGKAIRTLGIYNGELVAGGDFARIGGVESRLIARWNSSAWVGFGSDIAEGQSTIGAVRSLAVYQGALIAAGDFHANYYSNIKRWDAQAGSWGDLISAARLSGACYSLLVTGSDLIAAGSLSLTQGYSTSNWSCICHDGGGWTGWAFEDAEYRSLRMLTSFEGRVLAGSSRPDGQLYDLEYPSGPATALTSSWSPCEGDQGMYEADAILDYHHIMTVGTKSGLYRQIEPGTWSITEGDEEINALQIHNGSLFLGGYFYADMTSARNIARWDSTAWISLGSGLNGEVNALTVFNGGLIAGGRFSQSGDGALQLKGVAMWKDNGWTPLGAGLDGEVLALTVYRNELVAGGIFLTGSGLTVNGIARYDGTTWQPLGDGVDTDMFRRTGVAALAVYGDSLVAAGSFDRAEGNVVNNVAMWDGTHWYPMDQGLSVDPFAKISGLAVYENNLVAAGGIIASGSDTLYSIARWTGQGWAPLGSGIRSWDPTDQYNNWGVSPGRPTSLGVIAGDLVVGGSCSTYEFENSTAGSRILKAIGVWSEPVSCISRFVSRPAPTGVELRWQNPDDTAFRGTLIRYSTTGFPGDPTDGNPVPNGADGRFSASPGTRGSYVHLDAGGGKCYYSAFAYDAQGRYSGVARLKAEVVGDLSLAIGVFQNPVLTENLDIYLMGTKALKPGTVSLRVNGTDIPISENDTDRSVWKANYLLSSSSGSVHLRGCASDLADRDTCQTVTFSATYLRSPDGGEATSADGLLRVRIPPGSMGRDGYLLILPGELAALSGGKQGPQILLASAVPEGCRVLRRYSLSPSRDLAGSAGVEFRFHAGDLSPSETVAQLRIIQEGTGVLPSNLDENNWAISAEVRSLDPLLLVVEHSGSQAETPPLLRLLPAQPNPFRFSCQLGFACPGDRHVNLTVWDVAGRRVATLFDGPARGGEHWVTWDGSGDKGPRVGSGVYFVRLSAGRDQVSHARILVVR